MRKPIGRALSLVRRRQVLLGMAAVVLLAAGAWLLLSWFFVPAPPAVASAPAEQVIGFVTSARFGELSSARRQEYLRDFARRYFQMSPQEKQQADQLLANSGLSSSAQRQVRKEVAFSLVRSILAEYEKLSEAERLDRLRRLQGFANALNLKTGLAGTLRTDTNVVGQMLADEKSFQDGMRIFQRDLLDGFSATERAGMAQMGRDLQKLKGK